MTAQRVDRLAAPAGPVDSSRSTTWLVLESHQVLMPFPRADNIRPMTGLV